MYDLVVRGGRIVDGSGLTPYIADIGVKNGKIARIGRIVEKGAQEIDAKGHIVTPGFVDGHTHVDAQVNWDPLLAPSSWHGVTSVVMGNCGFTIAPVRKGHEDMVVQDLERAEDISGEAMAQGIEWNWETFPEYLDNLDSLPKAINCAANIGHSALRTFVMGERAMSEEATPEELHTMRETVREALRAGAIGFTTSRGIHHVRTDMRPVASRHAPWSEVESLVAVMGEEGLGVFEIAREESMRGRDPESAEAMKRLTDLSVKYGVPVTFGMSIVSPADEEAVPHLLETMEKVNDQGGRMFALSHSKGISIMLSFETQLPFDHLPVWKELRAKPLAEQAELLRDPDMRARLIEAADNHVYSKERVIGGGARPPNYDLIRVYESGLPPWPTVAELAKSRNQHPVEVMIDLALERGLKLWFLQIFHEAPETLMKLLKHPLAIMTFSDSGAHVSQIADHNLQTHLLAYWVRRRKAFSLEEAVQMITLAPARAFGLSDRGLVREGMAADLNVIDFDKLAPELPELVNDIPGGARRIIQRCKGFKATIVNGEVILEDGVATGANPGKVLRAGQMAMA